MLNRRSFLAVAAAAPAWANVAVRHPKVEIAYDAPCDKPNGLQATDDGLWVLNQGGGNRAYLIRYEDGKVLRAVDTDSDRGSGIGFDGQSLWLASTYNCKIIQANPRTGKTIASYDTPGCGPVNWPNPRRSPLAKPAPERPPQPASPPPQRRDTGAHGIEFKDGKMYLAVPPAQKIYRINPKGFQVEHSIPAPGDRPHGLGWEGRWLWCTDSNDNAFYKLDPETGAYGEKIQLSDSDPLPHGMSVWKGVLWYCDDVGVICRFPLPAAG